MFYKRIGARDASPVIRPEDLEEIDLRSMIKGGIIGVTTTVLAGGILWWFSRGEKLE
jgi:hypothetical protein